MAKKSKSKKQNKKTDNDIVRKVFDTVVGIVYIAECLIYRDRTGYHK